MSKQATRSETTRARLLQAALELFAAHGYSDVGTEEIVARAEVTRGALYHHFADKRDLFLAVHESLEADLVAELGKAMAKARTKDPVEAMLVAVSAFFDLVLEPGRARITLIDAPSVLGWAEWREIDERYGMGLTMAAIAGAMEVGRVAKQPVEPLAHLLLAALGEAGIMIATAEDPAAMRAQVEPAMLALVDGLIEN